MHGSEETPWTTLSKCRLHEFRVSTDSECDSRLQTKRGGWWRHSLLRDDAFAGDSETSVDDIAIDVRRGRGNDFSDGWAVRITVTMAVPSKTEDGGVEDNVIGLHVGMRRVETLENIEFIGENVGHSCFRKGPIRKTSGHGAVLTCLTNRGSRLWRNSVEVLKMEKSIIWHHAAAAARMAWPKSAIAQQSQ